MNEFVRLIGKTIVDVKAGENGLELTLMDATEKLQLTVRPNLVTGHEELFPVTEVTMNGNVIFRA